MAKKIKAHFFGGDLDGATLKIASPPPKYWGTYTPKSLEAATHHLTLYGDEAAAHRLKVPVFYERCALRGDGVHLYRLHGYQVPEGVGVILAED